MKNFKKLLVITTTLVVIAAFFTACNKPVVQTDTEVVITVTDSVMKDIEGKYLVDYLDALVEKEKLTYEATSGMIITINGTEAKAADNKYWLIYTSDADYSNSDWGTYEYDSVTYNSATKGIAELPLKADAVYIFVISQF